MKKLIVVAFLLFPLPSAGEYKNTFVTVYDAKGCLATIWVDEAMTIPSPNPFLVSRDKFVLAVRAGKYTIQLHHDGDKP